MAGENGGIRDWFKRPSEKSEKPKNKEKDEKLNKLYLDTNEELTEITDLAFLVDDDKRIDSLDLKHNDKLNLKQTKQGVSGKFKDVLRKGEVMTTDMAEFGGSYHLLGTLNQIRNNMPGSDQVEKNNAFAKKVAEIYGTFYHSPKDSSLESVKTFSELQDKLTGSIQDKWFSLIRKFSGYLGELFLGDGIDVDGDVSALTSDEKQNMVLTRIMEEYGPVIRTGLKEFVTDKKVRLRRQIKAIQNSTNLSEEQKTIIDMFDRPRERKDILTGAYLQGILLGLLQQEHTITTNLVDKDGHLIEQLSVVDHSKDIATVGASWGEVIVDSLLSGKHISVGGLSGQGGFALSAINGKQANGLAVSASIGAIVKILGFDIGNTSHQLNVGVTGIGTFAKLKDITKIFNVVLSASWDADWTKAERNAKANITTSAGIGVDLKNRRVGPYLSVGRDKMSAIQEFERNATLKVSDAAAQYLLDNNTNIVAILSKDLNLVEGLDSRWSNKIAQDLKNMMNLVNKSSFKMKLDDLKTRLNESEKPLEQAAIRAEMDIVVAPIVEPLMRNIMTTLYQQTSKVSLGGISLAPASVVGLGMLNLQKLAADEIQSHDRTVKPTESVSSANSGLLQLDAKTKTMLDGKGITVTSRVDTQGNVMITMTGPSGVKEINKTNIIDGSLGFKIEKDGTIGEVISPKKGPITIVVEGTAANFETKKNFKQSIDQASKNIPSGFNIYTPAKILEQKNKKDILKIIQEQFVPLMDRLGDSSSRATNFASELQKGINYAKQIFPGIGFANPTEKPDIVYDQLLYVNSRLVVLEQIYSKTLDGFQSNTIAKINKIRNLDSGYRSALINYTNGKLPQGIASPKEFFKTYILRPKFGGSGDFTDVGRNKHALTPEIFNALTPIDYLIEKREKQLKLRLGKESYGFNKEVLSNADIDVFMKQRALKFEQFNTGDNVWYLLQNAGRGSRNTDTSGFVFGYGVMDTNNDKVVDEKMVFNPSFWSPDKNKFDGVIKYNNIKTDTPDFAEKKNIMLYGLKTMLERSDHLVKYLSDAMGVSGDKEFKNKIWESVNTSTSGRDFKIAIGTGNNKREVTWNAEFEFGFYGDCFNETIAMENLQVTTSFHPEDGVVYGDFEEIKTQTSETVSITETTMNMKGYSRKLIGAYGYANRTETYDLEEKTGTGTNPGGGETGTGTNPGGGETGTGTDAKPGSDKIPTNPGGGETGTGTDAKPGSDKIPTNSDKSPRFDGRQQALDRAKNQIDGQYEVVYKDSSGESAVVGIIQKTTKGNLISVQFVPQMLKGISK